MLTNIFNTAWLTHTCVSVDGQRDLKNRLTPSDDALCGGLFLLDAISCQKSLFKVMFFCLQSYDEVCFGLNLILKNFTKELLYEEVK